VQTRCQRSRVWHKYDICGGGFQYEKEAGAAEAVEKGAEGEGESEGQSCRKPRATDLVLRKRGGPQVPSWNIVIAG